MANRKAKLKTKKESTVVGKADLKQEKQTGLLDSFMRGLDEDQIKRHTIAMQRAKKAKQQRDKRREEFDELTYEEDYYANKQAANAYLRPKINDDEVRIVTGTTEKKLEVLSNEVMALNLQPEAVAYDSDDNEIRDLGQDMMDVVKRTNDMEKDEDFWQDFLQELLRQRMAFAMEATLEVNVNGKKQIIL